MWVYDRETLAFLAVNDAAIATYGYSRDEFLAMTLLDIRPAEDHPRLAEWMKAEHDVVRLSGTWRHRWKDGTVRDVEIQSHEFTFARAAGPNWWWPTTVSRTCSSRSRSRTSARISRRRSPRLAAARWR